MPFISDLNFTSRMASFSVVRIIFFSLDAVQTFFNITPIINRKYMMIVIMHHIIGLNTFIQIFF